MTTHTNHGTLYVVGTPIGNLEDITIRALKTLCTVTAIAAEDTRRTLKLLNRYKIKNRLISCHAHSGDGRVKEIISMLEEGKNIALVTDAGMPVISDPGADLISACVKAGLPVTCIPGPCAAVAAVTVSGIDCSSFIFAGFLPLKGRQRKDRLKDLANSGVAAVIYESPERVIKTLSDIAEAWGKDISVCVAREITKLHEEAVRGQLSEVCAEFSSRGTLKGEVTIVVGRKERVSAADEAEVESAVRRMLKDGLSAKDAAARAAVSMGVSKNLAYRLASSIRDESKAPN